MLTDVPSCRLRTFARCCFRPAQCQAQCRPWGSSEGASPEGAPLEGHGSRCFQPDISTSTRIQGLLTDRRQKRTSQGHLPNPCICGGPQDHNLLSSSTEAPVLPSCPLPRPRLPFLSIQGHDFPPSPQPWLHPLPAVLTPKSSFQTQIFASTLLRRALVSPIPLQNQVPRP